MGKFNNNEYGSVENPDLVEMVENRLYTHSLNLFRKLQEDFLTEPFTLKDIKEAYNRPNGHPFRAFNYGKGNLDHLISLGLVDNNDNDEYEINHASMDIDRLLDETR